MMLVSKYPESIPTAAPSVFPMAAKVSKNAMSPPAESLAPVAESHARGAIVAARWGEATDHAALEILADHDGSVVVAIVIAATAAGHGSAQIRSGCRKVTLSAICAVVRLVNMVLSVCRPATVCVASVLKPLSP